jgi:hypothetical protein
LTKLSRKQTSDTKKRLPAIIKAALGGMKHY